MTTHRAKRAWLLTFVTLVLLIIAVGGVTRLTRSGLSIVEWRPVTGIIPPLTEDDWAQQFELYKKTPEYQHVNSHFEVSDYKRIFLWEYLHRVLGRVIFLVALVPGLWLWRRKAVGGHVVAQLSALVAFQGLVGWLMVKSGLNLRPQVSPYMLTAHYFMALLTVGTAYYHLSLTRQKPRIALPRSSNTLFKWLGAVLTLQVFYGCLTSGMKAGFAFNTYPLMGGQFLPPLGLSMAPAWVNLFENPITVQWIHRWTAMVVLAMVIALFFQARKALPDGQRGPFFHLLGVTVAQVILGISTLVLGVPTWLATLHQLQGAIVVLGFLNIAFRLKRQASDVSEKTSARAAI